MGLGSLWMILATVVLNLTMVIWHRVMSTRLGNAYGDLTALVALANILLVLTQGLSTTMTRLYAEDLAEDGQGAVKARLRRFLKPALLAGLAFLALMAALTPLAQHRLSLSGPWGYWMVAVFFSLNIVVMPLRTLTQGTSHFGWLGMSMSAEGLSRLVFGLLLAGLGAAGAVGSSVLALVVGALFCWPAAAGLDGKGGIRHERAQGKGWRDVALDSAALGAFSLICFLDIFVLKYALRDYPDRVAMYSRAALVGKSFLYLASALNVVLLPTVAHARSSAPGEKGEKSAKAALLKFLGVAAIANLAGLAMLWMFTPLAVRLLCGPGFESVGPLARAFAAAVVPLALFQLVLYYLLASRKHGVIWLVLGGCVAYRLILSLMGMEEWGVVEALGYTSTALLAGGLWMALWPAKTAAAPRPRHA